MPFNTNLINKIRYTFYAPIYDRLMHILDDSRKRSIDSLLLKADEKILIVGAGTGLDLIYLPKNTQITATDITPSMVRKIKQRSNKLQLNTDVKVMDGQHLLYSDAQFDIVILHLILAVIPDPYKAIKEAERVLKPGGKIAILDKFLPAHKNAGISRIIINQFTKFMFSDINRKVEDIVKTTKLEISTDIPENFGGIFRRILLQKPFT